MKEKSFEEKMSQEIAEKEAEIAERKCLLELHERFPNLRKHIDRWDRVRYQTREVNGMTTDCDIAHNCGCCSDSPLEIWPFAIIGGQRIYSNPLPFRVGERDNYAGERAYPGWESEMRDEGIPEIVLEKVRQFFRENPPQTLVDEEVDESLW